MSYQLPARRNPWFSPPALQYVARMNPGYGYMENPGYGYMENPDPTGLLPGWKYALNQGVPDGIESIEAGDRVTIRDRFGKEHTGRAVMPSSHGGWVLNMGGRYGRPGIADHQNFVRVRKSRKKYQGNPGAWHPGGGMVFDGVYHPGSGRYHHHERSPGDYDYGGGRWYAGRWYPGGGHYESNPYAFAEHEQNPGDAYGNWYEPPYEGWANNPGCAPNTSGGLDCYYTNPPRGLLPGWQYALNPEFVCARCGMENCGCGCGGDPAFCTCPLGGNPHASGYHFDENPIDIRGRSVPTSFSEGGSYHHVRVADPDEFTRIRTKTLSEPYGIKARIGRHLGRGPRGGKTDVQSYLFDAEMYTPEDVARWMEGHPTPAPIHMDISPLEASRRLGKVYGEAKERTRRPRKKVAKKVAARKKKGAKKRKTPPDAQRCVVTTASGSRCKGWRQKGKKKCSLHASGAARPAAKKKATKKTRKRKAAANPYKVPSKAKRCTAKTKSGTCKGRRLSGGDVCALHKHGIARSVKANKGKKKRKAKKRKRCRPSRTARCAAKTNCGKKCKAYAVGRSKYCVSHKRPGTRTGRTRGSRG